jgi:hypothetical protein
VLDHFHVIKLFNEKLNAVRRELHHQSTDDEHRKILNCTRGLLLKDPEILDLERNEIERLLKMLRINAPLAYHLTDDLVERGGDEIGKLSRAHLKVETPVLPPQVRRSFDAVLTRFRGSSAAVLTRLCMSPSECCVILGTAAVFCVS